MGTGKAVVSTPYWYATEMLAEGRGTIVPFKNPEALAGQIVELLDDEVKSNKMRKKAYLFTRNSIWKEVARKYLEVFHEVQLDRSRHPRPRHLYIENLKSITKFDLPELRLDHLKIFTDDTGILQHAKFTVPNRSHGYCVDDNARALIVAVMAQEVFPKDLPLKTLTSTYMSFMDHAFNEETGRFRNFGFYF